MNAYVCQTNRTYCSPTNLVGSTRSQHFNFLLCFTICLFISPDSVHSPSPRPNQAVHTDLRIGGHPRPGFSEFCSCTLVIWGSQTFCGCFCVLWSQSAAKEVANMSQTMI